jgi:glycosyltransferase involved in cell wall biosynthesis
MKNKRFFKLIVVNYNNYIYIKKCLDSIKNQTFKDFICIIVDDVSSDKSPNIAKIYEKRYPE